MSKIHDVIIDDWPYILVSEAPATVEDVARALLGEFWGRMWRLGRRKEAYGRCICNSY